MAQYQILTGRGLVSETLFVNEKNEVGRKIQRSNSDYDWQQRAPQFFDRWIFRGFVEVMPFGRLGVKIHSLEEMSEKKYHLDFAFKNGKSKYRMVWDDCGSTMLSSSEVHGVFKAEASI
jgi:hypothetical protein